MFDRFLLDAQNKNSYVMIAWLCFLITIFLGIFNYFMGANSLFLVALVALTLAYPVVRFIRTMDKEEIEKKLSATNLFLRHQKEMINFWFIFLGTFLGFYVLSILGLLRDFSYQRSFIQSLNSNTVFSLENFLGVLLTNMEILVISFLISLIAFPGLILILIWNSSLVAYYIFIIGSPIGIISTSLKLLPQGLLLIGAYILAGIAGSLLGYKLTRKSVRNNKKLRKQLIFDITILIIGSLILVVLATFLEIWIN